MKGASELRVGIFAALAICAAIYASTVTTDNPFEDKGYILHARLSLSLIHISEPTRPERISYAVFCLKKKK